MVESGGLSIVGMVVALALGAWFVIQVSKKVLKVWTFFFYAGIGALLIGGLSYFRLGSLPNPAVWGSGAVAFGWSAVLIRKRILKVVSIVAVLAASYLLTNQLGLGQGAQPERAKTGNSAKSGNKD